MARPGLAGFRRPEGFTAMPVSRLLRVLVLLLPLLAALLVLQRCSARPESLTDLRLVGARGTACVEVDVLLDESGSMVRYAAARAAALHEVFGWARRNLRSDDRVAVLGWAERAAVLLPAARVAGAGVPAPAPDLGGGTLLAPALRTVAGLPASPCSRWVVVVSDGLIGDGPAAVQPAARAAAIRGASLLLPAGSSVPDGFAAALPFATALPAPADDPARTALAVARAIADATGQRLER